MRKILRRGITGKQTILHRITRQENRWAKDITLKYVFMSTHVRFVPRLNCFFFFSITLFLKLILMWSFPVMLNKHALRRKCLQDTLAVVWRADPCFASKSCSVLYDYSFIYELWERFGSSRVHYRKPWVSLPVRSVNCFIAIFVMLIINGTSFYVILLFR